MQRAGRNGPALLEEGKTLAGEQKLGTAQMLMQAARLEAFPGWDRLDQIDRQPGAAKSGGADVGRLTRA